MSPLHNPISSPEEYREIRRKKRKNRKDRLAGLSDYDYNLSMQMAMAYHGHRWEHYNYYKEIDVLVMHDVLKEFEQAKAVRNLVIREGLILWKNSVKLRNEMG